MEWMKHFNDNYANAISALTPFVIGLVSWLYYRIFVESQRKVADTIYILPSFWSVRKRHRIDTVKRFELTEDRKNYKELETFYTPESWNEVIEVRRRFFKTVIVPKDSNDILVVTIKRDPHEQWKIIYFNR